MSFRHIQNHFLTLDKDRGMSIRQLRNKYGIDKSNIIKRIKTHREKYYMDDNVVPIKSNKSEKEIATELKNELIEAAGPFLAICSKAHKEGFIVNFQFGVNSFGQWVITAMTVSKVY